MILVILLILPGIMAQTLPTTHRVASEISDQTIVLSFHSWGEGQTITLDLDNYLPSFRPSSKRIIFTAPPEVEIEVDQTTGKTTLRAQVDWIGTREIIFSLADIHEVPARKQQIINYESELIKQRIPDRVQSQLNEFQDMVMFNYLDKILEDLEKESSFIEVPPIDVIRDNSSFKIDVGETIDLRISILTENEEGIKTLKPQLGVNIISESEPTEAEIVEEDGTSILILIPLVFIILALLISLFVYFKNNRNKVRTVYHKLIPEKSKLETTKIQKDIDNLKSQLRETKSIESSLGKVPIEDSAIKFYTTIKEFFNTLTHPNYEFTFSELKKEIIQEDLDLIVKKQLISLSLEISEIRFSGQTITSSKLKEFLKKSIRLIEKSIINETRLKKKEKIKFESERPIISLFHKLKLFSKKGKQEKPEKVKSFSLKEYLHDSLGLFKTPKEKYQLKLKKQKEKEAKEREKLKAIERKESEKERKIRLDKNREKREKLELQRLKAKEEARLRRKKFEEKKRKLEEKLRKKQEKRRKIRKFFHDTFGLYKTRGELARIEREEYEEARDKRLRKLARKHRFLHSLHLYKYPAEIRQEQRAEAEKIRIERLRETLKKKADRKRKTEKTRARRERIREILHAFHLYKYTEEIRTEREKSRRDKISKAREKQESAKNRKELRRRILHTLGLYKYPVEVARKRAEERSENISKAKLKEYSIKRREEKLKAIGKSIHNFFHSLGFYKTPSEIKEERREKGTEKASKTRKEHLRDEIRKEQRRNLKRKIRRFFSTKLGLFKTESELKEEKRLKIILRAKEEQLKRLKNIGKEEKRKEEKRKLRKFYEKLKNLERKTGQTTHKILHKLGFFKTKSEHEKSTRLRKEEVKEFKSFTHKILHSLGFFKTSLEQSRAKTRRREEIREVKSFTHKILHSLGFFKTKLEHEKSIRLRKEEVKEFKSFTHKILHSLGFFKTSLEQSRAKTRRREEIREVKSFTHKILHSLGFFKTKLEHEKSIRLRKEHIKELKIKEAEFKSGIRKHLINKIKAWIEKRKLTPEVEINILMNEEREAVKKKNLKKAEEIEEKIRKLYKHIKHEKPHLLTRELHSIYNKTIDEVDSLRKIHIEIPPLEKLEESSLFVKIKSLFVKKSPQHERKTLVEIKELIRKSDSLISNNKNKAKHYYLLAYNRYKSLSSTAKISINPHFLPLKEKILHLAIDETLDKAYDSVKHGNAKKAEELYSKLSKAYYQLPSESREQFQKKRYDLFTKLRDKETNTLSTLKKDIQIFKRKESSFFSKLKDKLSEHKFKPSRFKLPKLKKQEKIEVKESFIDYLTKKAPKFKPRETVTHDELKTEKRKVKDLKSAINSIKKSIKSKNHVKAKDIYYRSISLMKDLHPETPSEIRNNFYNELLSLKRKILEISLNNMLKETKKSLDNPNKARSYHNAVTNIYNHLNQDNEKYLSDEHNELNNSISETLELINKNKLDEAKQLYDEISQKYETLPPEKKRLFYNKIVLLYQELSRK